jgi:cytochrome b561
VHRGPNGAEKLELFDFEERLRGRLPTHSMKPAPTRLKIVFWLDVVLLIAVCAQEQIGFTGAILHEWTGLTFAALIVVHLLFSWSWIATQTRRFFPIASGRALFNYVLNLSLFAVVTAVIFSGIMMSQEAVPAFTGKRTPIPSGSAWFFVHNQGSNVVVALVGLHLALNWDWGLAAGRKLLGWGKADSA